ncbi:hypothetical protein ABFX02_14G302800 [Erythranthe guttata]
MTLIHAMVANPSHDYPKKTNPKGKKVKWQTKQPSSWDQIKNMLICKHIDQDSQSHHTIHPSSKDVVPQRANIVCSKLSRLRRDAAHGNSRVVNQADKSPENCCTPAAAGQETRLLSHKTSYGSSSSLSVRSSSGRGLQLRKLSGCYECHAVVDPARYPLIPITSLNRCSECGEVFPEIEILEHHQAIMHAVSELGPEDSSRDIVEIIFKSSWLKKDNPVCQIERILKVHNTHRKIQRFEDYRDSVKARASISNNPAKRNPRCAADGNELLRFHSATLACPLGAHGSSSLCGSSPPCGVCTIIRHGFQGNSKSGIRTTATSGRAARDCLGGSATRGAMLVCRVIAGKVKRVGDADEDGGAGAAPIAGSYDSLGGCAGVYSNIEELYVFSSRAILPCFVVIYKALES